MRMVISWPIGGRPHPGVRPAGARDIWETWRRLWRRLLAAVTSHHPEPDPTSLPRLAPLTADSGSAFVDLFARYHVPLLDYLYGMTRDRELAADLAQDTFARAFAAAPTLTGIDQPRAWLYHIATHVALNAIRHRERFEWLPLSRVHPADGGPAAEAWGALPPVELPPAAGDLAANVAERDAIWSVLAELPAPQRAVLLLQAVAGFEAREIATHLALSEANVRKRLF